MMRSRMIKWNTFRLLGNLPPGVHPEAQQWFNTVDTDRSGYINQKELKQALLNSNSTPFNDETCQMMFSEYRSIWWWGLERLMKKERKRWWEEV